MSTRRILLSGPFLLITPRNQGITWQSHDLWITGPLWGESKCAQGSAIRGCDMFFVVSPNQLLNKQSGCRSLERPWCSLNICDDQGWHWASFYRIFPGHFFFIKMRLIPLWINNEMISKIRGKINYTFQNFNGCTVIYPRLYNGYNYLSMGFKIVHVSKRGPGNKERSSTQHCFR